MKRKALLLLFTAIFAFAVQARAQTDHVLFAFEGFDYQDPNTATNPDPEFGYLMPGEGYNLVGFVTSVGSELDPYTDFSVNEYTIHVKDLTVDTRFFFAGFLEVHFLNGGRSRYYGDPISGGTHGTYGVNPPNATSPSTFIDGTLELGGSVDVFVLTYDFNLDQGNTNGTMNLDEGPLLIYVPIHNGWTLAGLAGRPNATVPTGYDNQLSGECRIPNATPTTHKTWGAVKALYR